MMVIHITYIRIVSGEKVKIIDLLNQNIGSDEDSRIFLNGIIYGDYEYETKDADGNTINNNVDDFERKFGVQVASRSEPLFEYLTNNQTKIIREELGTYYMEDAGEEPTGAFVLDANKTEKRVITYIFE